MICSRCGEETPRLTVAQRHCPRCAREVAALIECDTRRRGRFAPKDLTEALR
jgi:predicted DCC family thiol-disulfide oxidoreductase YuxK